MFPVLEIKKKYFCWDGAEILSAAIYFKTATTQMPASLKSVLGIRDILVRIWIQIGSVPLTNESGSCSGSGSNSGSDFFLH
jgi:hypothetical protein